MEKNAEAWLSLFVAVILFITLVVVTIQRDKFKQEAVDKGFAEWHIISGTKEIEFKWKENK